MSSALACSFVSSNSFSNIWRQFSYVLLTFLKFWTKPFNVIVSRPFTSLKVLPTLYSSLDSLVARNRDPSLLKREEYCKKTSEV